jgi:hypothetical protein
MSDADRIHAEVERQKARARELGLPDLALTFSADCTQMLGWRWTRIFSVPPLIWPVEVGYRLFVRNRSVLFPILARFVPRRSDPS